MGLTGVTFEFDAIVELPREFVRLRIPYERLICTGDAEIIFASHARCDYGSAIVCHMGSTGFAATHSGRVRFGGWGPTIGDEGSGYHMGLEVLKAIASEHDHRKPHSLLWHEVCSWLSEPTSPNHESIDDWIRGAIVWNRRIAEHGVKGRSNGIQATAFSFAHTVAREYGLGCWRNIASCLTHPLFAAFTKGDPKAQDIVVNAAKDLAAQHYSACNIAELRPESAPIVLYGGVITHNQAFQSELLAALRTVWNNNDLLATGPITPKTAGTMRPACGALLFALGDSHTKLLRLPPKSVLEQVAYQSHIMPHAHALNND